MPNKEQKMKELFLSYHISQGSIGVCVVLPGAVDNPKFDWCAYAPGFDDSRLEVAACASAFTQLIKDNWHKDHQVTVISDSDYLHRGFNEWLPAWKAGGWKKQKIKKPWKRLYKNFRKFKACRIARPEEFPEHDYKLTAESNAELAMQFGEDGKFKNKKLLPVEEVLLDVHYTMVHPDWKEYS